MDVKLRRASLSDLELLLPLLRDLYRGDLGPGFSDIVAEYAQDTSAHCLLVAETEGRAVGVLVGSYRLDIDYECPAGFVDAIVVQEDFRGRGVGLQLVGEFARWSAEKGCKVLQVLNARREFFEAMGFEERPACLHQAPLKGLLQGEPS